MIWIFYWLVLLCIAISEVASDSSELALSVNDPKGKQLAVIVTE